MTCQAPDGCPDRGAGDSGYCRTHYIRAYRAGHLNVKRLDDPAVGS